MHTYIEKPALTKNDLNFEMWGHPLSLDKKEARSIKKSVILMFQDLARLALAGQENIKISKKIIR